MLSPHNWRKEMLEVHIDKERAGNSHKQWLASQLTSCEGDERREGAFSSTRSSGLFICTPGEQRCFLMTDSSL